jgi:hypothetical protein
MSTYASRGVIIMRRFILCMTVSVLSLACCSIGSANDENSSWETVLDAASIHYDSSNSVSDTSRDARNGCAVGVDRDAGPIPVKHAEVFGGSLALTNRNAFAMALLSNHKAPDIVRRGINAHEAIYIVATETKPLRLSFILCGSESTDQSFDFVATNMTVSAMLDKICSTWDLVWMVPRYTVIIRDR